MLNQIQNPNAKILYLVQHLFRQSKITLPQKDFLKMKIIAKDPQIFQYLENYLSSNNERYLEAELILYSSQQNTPKKDSCISSSSLIREESNFSNKAKMPSEIGSEDDSDDEFDEKEEKLFKEKEKKERTQSEVIDLRRASFSEYYNFVKEDLYHHGSADDLDNIEYKAIAEVKSQMEESKMDMSKMELSRKEVFYDKVKSPLDSNDNCNRYQVISREKDNESKFKQMK